MSLAHVTTAALLEQLAARKPAPAGGTAAALTGASAAALTEMITAFALQRAPDAGVGTPARPATGDGDGDGDERERLCTSHRRAGALRVRLLELAEHDTRSYQPVLDALALAPGDPRRGPALLEACSEAAQVPLEVALAATEVAELAAACASLPGNEQLLGDVSAAVILAEAATCAAVALVELNLVRTPEDPRVASAGALARRAGEHRAALARELHRGH